MVQIEDAFKVPTPSKKRGSSSQSLKRPPSLKPEPSLLSSTSYGSFTTTAIPTPTTPSSGDAQQFDSRFAASIPLQFDDQTWWQPGVSSVDEQDSAISGSAATAASASATAAPQKKSLRERLFPPILLLLFFTVINMCNYFDRGSIAAVLSEVSDAYDLTYFESGALGSAFMIGFMFSSPVFAQLATLITPTFILAFGLAVSALAIISTGSSFFYYWLLVSRCLVGIGEASFVGLAPTCIDDAAPKSSRTSWLSLFFMAIPVGTAAGYVAASLLELLSWRIPFLSNGCILLLLAGVCLLVPTSYNKRPKKKLFGKLPRKDSAQEQQTEPAEREYLSGLDPLKQVAIENQDDFDEAEQEHKYNIFTALFSLLCNASYMCVVFGYSAHTFVIGAVAFWGPSYISAHFDITHQHASIGFSLCSLVTGILGTLFGGLLVDRFGGSKGFNGVFKSMVFSSICLIVGFPIGMLGLAVGNIYVFFVCIFISEFFIFCTIAPVNGSIMSAVPNGLRSFAMAFSIFSIHLLGDFPSPIVFGAVSDLLGGPDISMLLLWCILVPASVFWGCAALFALRRHNQRLQKQLQTAYEVLM